VGAIFCAWTWGDALAGKKAALNTASPSDTRLILQFALIVNQYRETIGCRPLRWDKRLASLAQGHSEDMATVPNYLEHDSTDGKSFLHRVLKANLPLAISEIPSAPVAENLVWSGASPSHILQVFLASPEHRANIDNCRFTHQGIGLKNSKWTHDFAVLY
jgi:uncharacterized protein YkwD